MIVWLNLDREHALEPERELRARADGAVHARRGPRRLHRAGRAPARSCAHRVRLRLERRARDAQLPLRPDPARRRQQDRLRADRARGPGSREWRCACATRCTRPSSSRSCGATSSRRAPSDGRPPGARGAVRVERLPGAAGARGDPAAPGPARRARAWSSRRWSSLAGLLRALQRSVDGEYWIWYSENAGQRLFFPPDVSGWDDSRWLDTSTVRGRFELVSRALTGRVLDGDAVDDYDETETPEQARGRARAPGRATRT